MNNIVYIKNEVRGIGKFLKKIDNKTGLFLCMECNKEYKGNLHSWYYRGRKSCGHKNTKHRLYHRYSKMIKRCHDESNSRYPYYGARGIKVCDRWRKSFDNFLEDMEPSFKEGLELDRINNDGNYTPDNCRWTTHSENMLNRRDFENKEGLPPGVRRQYNRYHGRCQVNKKSYTTETFDNPEDAYESLQKLKRMIRDL